MSAAGDCADAGLIIRPVASAATGVIANCRRVIVVISRARYCLGFHDPGAAFLRPPEIEAVADYLIAHVKGKGEPAYDDCITFFGEGSRVCGIYKTPQQASGSAPGDAPKN